MTTNWIKCDVPEKIEGIALEHALSNIKCKMCDKKGHYLVADEIRECKYYFDTYLPLIDTAERRG